MIVVRAAANVPSQAMGCRAHPETRERLRREFCLCGVPRGQGIGVFGRVNEELASTLAEQALL